MSTHLSTELTVLILAMSALMALGCKAWTGVAPCGLIVPGALVVAALESWPSLAEVLAATALIWCLMKLITRWAIVFGARLFALTLAVAVVVETGAFLLLHTRYPAMFPNNTLGMVAPGLMAYPLLKQPVPRTLAATAVTTAAAAAGALALLAV